MTEVIDVFNHVFPKEYLDALPKPLDAAVARQVAQKKASVDIEYRLKTISRIGIDRQILSVGEISILDDLHFSSKLLSDLAVAVNDGIAMLTERHPDHFSGVGTVNLYDVDGAVDELDRCIEDLGLLGVQVPSNVGGKPLDLPEFDPFYERLCRLDAGLWVHPTDMRQSYDWMNQYNLGSALGWGIDESLAMFRIARGGVFERHPKLKVITHHMGVLIPFYADRIHRFIMREGKGSPPPPLTKDAMDYLKMFYVDTAEGSWKPALVCSQMFFGSEHLLFATDYPFGPLVSDENPGEVLKTVKELEIPEEEKEMILGGNAKKLLNLK